MVFVQVCYVPTLSALAADCGGLFSFWRQCQQLAGDVVFDFSTCAFLRPEAVAFLAGIARTVQQRGRDVYFMWETLSPAVSANLAQNGFMLAFGGPQTPWTGNSVPYCHHPTSDGAAFAHYIQHDWLGRGWVGLSPGLVDYVTSNVSEVYVNAFEHANSPVGLHMCGQHFPKMHVLSLTMVDFGVGIPRNVREFVGATHSEASRLSGAQCVRWAFQRGASTRGGGQSGGLGLDNLSQFVAATDGSFEIYSHEGRATLKNKAVTFSDSTDTFHGTMVTIRLRCDERYYALGSELESLNSY